MGLGIGFKILGVEFGVFGEWKSLLIERVLSRAAILAGFFLGSKGV